MDAGSMNFFVVRLLFEAAFRPSEEERVERVRQELDGCCAASSHPDER